MSRAWPLVLLALSAVILSPFAGYIVLALWLAIFSHPLQSRLARALGERCRLAAGLTVTGLALLLVPIGLLVTSIVIDAIALVQQLLASEQGKGMLAQLVSSRDGGASSGGGITGLLVGQADRAWALLQMIAGATAHAVIGFVIVIAGMYAMLIEGRTWYSWGEEHAPLPKGVLRRFAGAFVETGRGLAFGVIGAGLIQSIFATGAYVVLDIPHALALGMLTLVFSLVPLVGCAIVWVPIVAGLAITGRTTAAIGLALYGTFVVGSVDNFARPFLAKRGQLRLPTYLVLVSMFGGVELFGGWGLIWGPLILRLAKEALLIARGE